MEQKKKVLITNLYFQKFTGSELHVLEFAHLFKEKGYDVVIAVLKKQWNNFNSDVYFKNENVKMIYSLLYARPEVRNINIGYSEELLEDAEKAKKWYINLVKKIHPDANKACPEEAQKAMTELEIIYERIQKCFANEEEE